MNSTQVVRLLEWNSKLKKACYYKTYSTFVNGIFLFCKFCYQTTEVVAKRQGLL